MRSQLSLRVHEAVEGLAPGYFALVMGSGIISVAMGACAITVLAGARIVEKVVHVRRTVALAPRPR